MLTVLFATRNRAAILRSVLECYCLLRPPSSGWKLIVADNGSSDVTQDVLASFSERLPLSWVVEPGLGKNRALNAAVPLLEGDLTVLTDDDVYPYSDWLFQLRQAADAHPEFSIFGGTIVPRWETPPPLWLGWIDLGPVFAITPVDMVEGELQSSSVTLVQGPNMAMRTSIFESGVRFDVSIGPRGANYPMGSETELILRLHRQGLKAWHAKRAIVEHFVRKEQLNMRWVLERVKRFGRGRCRLDPNPRRWFGFPRYLVRDVPKETLKLFVAAIILNPRARFRAHWRLNYMLGEGYEAFVVVRERVMRRVWALSKYRLGSGE